MTYLDRLNNMYIKSRGIMEINPYDTDQAKDFDAFIKEREKIANLYSAFLEYMGQTDYSKATTLELNTGMFDTLSNDNKMHVLTPYDDAFDLRENLNKKVQFGNIEVNNGLPTLYDCNFNKIRKDYFHKLYMVNNPIGLKELIKMADLHNGAKKDIIVGIYGSVNDNDYYEKQKLLTNFRNQLELSYLEDAAFINDAYFRTIVSQEEYCRKRK